MNESKLATAVEARKRAGAVRETCEFTGWDDVIVPELNKLKQQLSTMLVHTTLGNPMAYGTGGAPVVSAAQIAGQIYGIDVTIELVQNIFARGQRANEWIHRNDLSA